jgi:hypothetical protein
LVDTRINKEQEKFNFDTATVVQLKQELKRRGLITTGNKAELIKRIKNNKEEKPLNVDEEKSKSNESEEEKSESENEEKEYKTYPNILIKVNTLYVVDYIILGASYMPNLITMEDIRDFLQDNEEMHLEGFHSNTDNPLLVQRLNELKKFVGKPTKDARKIIKEVEKIRNNERVEIPAFNSDMLIFSRKHSRGLGALVKIIMWLQKLYPNKEPSGLHTFNVFRDLYHKDVGLITYN